MGKFMLMLQTSNDPFEIDVRLLVKMVAMTQNKGGDKVCQRKKKTKKSKSAKKKKQG